MNLVDEWTGEPLTTADMIRELLNLAERHEWVLVTHYCNRSCNCVRDQRMECPTCGGVEPDHRPDCRAMKVLQWAEAYLRAEEELEHARAEAVPHHAA